LPTLASYQRLCGRYLRPFTVKQNHSVMTPMFGRSDYPEASKIAGLLSCWIVVVNDLVQKRVILSKLLKRS